MKKVVFIFSFLALAGVATASFAVAQPIPEPDVKSVEPPYEVLLLKGNLARGKRDFKNADHYFTLASQKPDAGDKLYVYWARTHREQGNLNRAMQILDAGIAKFATSTSLRLEKGLLLAVAERWKDLESILNTLPDSANHTAVAHLLRARLNVSRQAWPAAQKEYEKTVKINGQFQAVAFAELAEVHSRLGAQDEALSTIEQAITTARSARERVLYEQRKATYLASNNSRKLYSLRLLTGTQYDSNVNLSPILFKNSAESGIRYTATLQQQLTPINKKKAQLGIQSVFNQSAHIGSDTKALKQFNATVMSGELFWTQKLTSKAIYRLNAEYSSIFLLFRPSSDERHFSEQWNFTPELALTLKKTQLRIRLTGQWSRYYADNQVGSKDDRSTNLIDWITKTTLLHNWGNFTAGIRVGGSYYDSRGSNFDNVGLTTALLARFTHNKWLTTAESRFEFNDYTGTGNQRKDRVFSANVAERFKVSKNHALGFLLAFDRNFARGAVYEYRRIVAGISYQGLMLDL